MRVGIDARLNAYRQGGIPVYTRALLDHLSACAGPADTLVALQHMRQRRPLPLAPGVQRGTLLTPPHHRLEALTLPAELLRHRLDVTHFPDVIAPQATHGAAVITIHDLAFLRFPEILDASARRYYGQVRASVQRADAIIAVSESTRRDICTLLDVPPARVDVIYEAAAPHYRPVALRPGALRIINGHLVQQGAFLLFVSTIEPRKNLATLLRALRQCRDQQPAVPYQLVLAGARGWNDASIFALLRELRLGDAVLWLGSVSAHDLLWLYNACRLYLNPSHYEGFGLPVVEALACGAPTLVADTSSLPEVGGAAVHTLPPDDAAAWAAEITRLWHDDTQRHALAARGPAQAARFSWGRAAQQTWAVYARAAERSRA